MITVALINYKGGVGKTTLCTNIGAELATSGQRVLLVDLDPQASLTFSLLRVEDWSEQYQETQTIKRWFDLLLEERNSLDFADLPVPAPRVRPLLQAPARLDLVCSHLGLIGSEADLAVHILAGGLAPDRYFRNFVRVHDHLAEGLQVLADQDQYDYCLLDCPPSFGIVTKNAISASDFYLVPARPDYLSTLGVHELKRHVEKFASDYQMARGQSGQSAPRPIRLLGVAVTMARIYSNQPSSDDRYWIHQLHREGIPVFSTTLRDNHPTYGWAPSSGVPIVLRQARKPIEAIVQDELRHVASEFCVRIEELLNEDEPRDA